LLKGQITLQDHRLWVQASIHYLQGQPQQHEFLNVWREMSQLTEFTQADFSSTPN
jgi:hypothetical protein